MKREELTGDDAKMARAVEAAFEGVGLALFETIRLAVKAADGPNVSEKHKTEYRKLAVGKWTEAGERVIDLMMEDE